MGETSWLLGLRPVFRARAEPPVEWRVPFYVREQASCHYGVREDKARCGMVALCGYRDEEKGYSLDQRLWPRHWAGPYVDCLECQRIAFEKDLKDVGR